MPCTKFGYNWPSGSGEEDFYNLLVYFRNFVIISPWKRIGPSFKITRISFILGYFVPSLVEIGPAVLEKKNVVSLFHNYLPLEKGLALHLKKI